MGATLGELMDLVAASPARVAEQDREGWVALFAPEGVVEDPVGAGPHLRAGPGGEDQVGLFWDTFIAGTKIRFEVAQDRRLGLGLARDVMIHTQFPSGFALQVPAYLLYELEEGEEGLRIARLAAHWALRKMVLKVLLGGPRAWWTMTLLSFRMMANQRLRGLLGYMKALTVGVFGRGKEAALALGEALSGEDPEAFIALFAEGAEVELERGTSTPEEAHAALSALGELRITDPIACGYTVAARAATTRGGEAKRGLAVLEFDSRSKKIRKLRLFFEEE